MDPFKILRLPRRPLLTDEEIGRTYRELARSAHPDRDGGDTFHFRELGEAAAILRDPSRRLRELVGRTNPNRIPNEASDLFSKIAIDLRNADLLLEKHASTSTSLGRALLTEPMKTLSAELDLSLSSLKKWRLSLDHEMAALDLRWPEHDPDSVSLLADSFAYADRWEIQLCQRKLALDSILS